MPEGVVNRPRLTSLELHGYKTFAARTLFAFADTVTAIVGPNGSGKSNIADSIRWVLGEQSYSLLRGKKTEDMIFAGSEQRPRAGMASATITFDNSDGWLPIDFSEVAITRRAYRDGENEYLLNGQRVRLRDVSELLSQSGLAERTYTIIGQGLVDAALALKAEERRRLFEEAAGIGLHRSRREESLRRLDTTKRNLERVQDILAELQPRLRSLERQAKRAQDYDQVRADLQLALREWYAYHWHQSQKDLALAREASRGREVDLERVRAGQEVSSGKVAAAREVIQSLRAQLSTWHRQLSKLHSQRESIVRDLAVSDERTKAFHQQIQAVQDERLRLEEETGYNQERLEKAIEEENRRKVELEEARSEAEAARKAFTARLAERGQAEKNAQTSRQALSGLTARQAHLQARLEERQAQAERQASSIENIEKTITAAEKELEDAAAHLNTATSNFQEALARRKGTEEALQAHNRRISELETSHRQAVEARSRIGADLARLQAQLDVLEGAEEALSGYGTGAKFLIQEAREKRLSGARGALSSQLEVSAELETAVTAALGEALDAVLFEQESGLSAALNLLEKNPSRAVMLSLDSVYPGPLSALDGNGFGPDEIYGLAADLVKAPPELRPAVDLLLGRAWIVCDRRVARRLLATLRSQSDALPSDLRIITLRGEVFTAGGLVLAGQEGKPGTLSRPRQRRELKKKLEDAQKEFERMDLSVRTLEKQAVDLQHESESFTSALRAARKDEDTARTVQGQADLGVEKARRQLHFQRDQAARLGEDQKQFSKDLESTRTELKELESKINTAREDVRRRNTALSELSLEEFQTRVSHWNARASIAERSAGEALNRRKEQEKVVERANVTRRSLLNRLDEYHSGIKDLETSREELRGTEAVVSREISDLHVLIDPAEKELESREEELTSLQEHDDDLRQSLSTAEHFSAQAKINLARRQESLDNLRHRIEDDFGLVAFEYNPEISGQATLPLEGMVEQLPVVYELNPAIEENIKRQRALLRRMGPINPEARAEYTEVKERYGFLTEQVADLNKAEQDIKEVIAELDMLMEREFRRTFDAVAHEFRVIFTRLFGGGSARLVLTDPEDMTGTGIDIEAKLPGRRTQGLSLLSGGERSLTATALVFALLKVSPTPFCLLDEVDAMLDESNVARFRDLLRELSQNTQFVIVTHNRNTVQAADVIYGVTMGSDSSSQVLSLKLDQVKEIID